MRERGGFIRPEWWDRRAKEGWSIHTLRGRKRILTTKEVIHDFSADQRGSISPTMLLATLPQAIALMLFLGACGQTGATVGNTPTPTEIARTQTPLPTPTIEVRPTFSPTATETLISPEFAQKLSVEIGSPISYKPAPKNSLLSSHYEWMRQEGKLNEFGSPDVKFDEKGNVSIPGYPLGTLLQELNGINPANLPNPQQNEGGMIAIQEIVNGDLVRAREAFKQGKTSEAREALEKAEQDIAGKKFDGVEMVKPATPEEQAKFGTMGRMLGVAKPLVDFYLRLVQTINSIP